MRIPFTLNGKRITMDVAPDRRVVDLLREDLGLTGAKEGCGSGECGACTILVDGEARLSCLMMAAQLEGREVTTIEGLDAEDHLHPLQEAFIAYGAVQCGFCSPGMILSAAALLKKDPSPGLQEIRQALSGNLCRCTGYQKIVEAVAAAARTMSGGEKDAMSKVLLPRSLPELWDILEKIPEARLFAGGTDILVQLRAGAIDAPALIGLEKIGDLKGVREESGCLWIGAVSTHAELLRNPLICQALPVLIQGLGQLGSPLIRNMGTIGGNICTASPAGDALPPLYVLDASVTIQSKRGKRQTPIREFITGPGTTTLKKGEILAGIQVRIPTDGTRHNFEKVGQRRSLSCAIASLAALIRVSETGLMEDVRLAWGSVAPTVMTAPQIEAYLVGQRPSPALLEEAASRIRKAVSPIDDVRATAAYRREVSGNLLLRLIPTLMKTADYSVVSP